MARSTTISVPVRKKNFTGLIVAILAVCLIGIGGLIGYFVFQGNPGSSTLPGGQFNQPPGESAVSLNQSENQKELEELVDSDGDGMSDEFEKNVAHSDPLIPSDRYLLYVDTDDSISFSLPILERFIQDNKLLEENVFLLRGENATFEKFMEAVEKIASKSDGNDLVYVSLNTHGDPGCFYGSFEVLGFDEQKGEKIRFTRSPFAVTGEPTAGFPEKSLSYKELGRILNGIKCQKMLVTYCSCAGNTAVEILAKNAKYPRVVIGPLCHPYTLIAALGSGPIFNAEALKGEDVFMKVFMNNGVYEEIGDRYLSVELLYQYNPENYPKEIIEETMAKIDESVEKGRILWTAIDMPVKVITTVKMADPSNITSDFYFGETKVKDFYWPASLLRNRGIEDLPRYRNYPGLE